MAEPFHTLWGKAIDGRDYDKREWTQLQRYIVRREKPLERVEVVGPMAKAKAVMEALFADGWHITRSGPWIRGAELDGDRFLFVAERPAQPDPSPPVSAPP